MYWSYSLLQKLALLAPILLVAVYCLIPATTNAQVTPGASTNFITTWNTENPGTSGTNQITIPGTGAGYSYEIYWEDTASSTINGTTTLITTSSHTLTFPAPGIYRVEIAGAFPRIFFNNGGDRQKILTVEQWGNIAWSSMVSAFRGASNLRIPATDAPDLSGVTSLDSMFGGATSFNDPIDHWDVSNVTNMSSTFVNTPAFNQPLNNWNTSKVVSFSQTFYGASTFNQPLHNWNTASATSMFRMFRNSAFNQDISNWDVSNVTQMTQMFRNTPFNQPIGAWNTASLQYAVEMFIHNTVFDQSLANWDISNITSSPGGGWIDKGFSGMFNNGTLSTANLDATLSSWASQATTLNKTNIPLHIGLKTYSPTGAAAIATLKGLGWTISEQYRATYNPGTRATLIGTGTQAPLNSGATTTSVEIKPDKGCAFQSWSDGNKANPRTDVLTDNLTVSAIVSCSSMGTSVQSQVTNLEAMGKQTEADILRDKYAQFFSSTTPTNSTSTPTLTDTIATVDGFLNGTIPYDRTKAQELIVLLLELVHVLAQLMLQMAMGKSP